MATIKDDAYWKAKLTPEQYRIMRQKGTEMPGSGKWLQNKEKGTYTCAACGKELFDSDTKFDSDSGWPAFWDAKNTTNIEFKEDNIYGIRCEEVLCKNCGAHLGHVFDEETRPTGKWYCINFACLDFKPAKQ